MEHPASIGRPPSWHLNKETCAASLVVAIPFFFISFRLNRWLHAPKSFPPLAVYCSLRVVGSISIDIDRELQDLDAFLFTIRVHLFYAVESIETQITDGWTDHLKSDFLELSYQLHVQNWRQSYDDFQSSRTLDAVSGNTMWDNLFASDFDRFLDILICGLAF